METKEDLRKIILEQMCETVQDIRSWAENKDISSPNTLFIENYCPTPFKPSVSDKMLFKKFIDKVIDITYNETKNNPHKKVTIHGLHVLTRYYYPYYGWCDELELEKAKNNTNI